MKRAICFTFAVVATWLVVVAPAQAQSVTKEALKAQIFPKHYLRSYDVVTVSFSQAIVSSPRKAKAPGKKYLRFEPPVRGVYRWLDPKTLEFRPTQPWPALSQIRVIVPKGLTSRSGSALLDSTYRLLRSMLPSPLQVKPQNKAVDIKGLKYISLTFPRPIPVKALQQALQLELRKLPGLFGAPPEKVWSRRDWWLKRRNREPGKTAYWLVLRRPLPKAKHITIKMMLALPSTQTNTASPFWSSSFSTQQPFRLQGVRCGKGEVTVSQGKARYTQEQALNCNSGVHSAPSLVFSRPLGANNPGLLRRLIRISPTVANLQLVSKGNRLFLRGEYRRSVLYRMTLVGSQLPIRDNTNQTLLHKGQQTIFFYFGRQSPLLRWKQHRGILERFGPQMMPMYVRGTTKLDLRIHPIAPGDSRFWDATSTGFQVDETLPPLASGSIPKASKRAGDLRAVHTQKYLRTLGTPKVSRVVSISPTRSSRPKVVGLNLRPFLRSLLPPKRSMPGSKPGVTNHFLVGLRQLDHSSHRRYSLVQVTDLALTSVEEKGKVRFVVTSLKTAKPVKQASVIVEGIEGPPARRRWVKLWQGTTDSSGFTTLPRLKGLNHKPVRIRVKHGSDQLVLDTRKAPPKFASSHWSPSSRGWLSWLSRRQTSPVTEAFRAHLFTERPVYRPGEPVHLKGLVRSLKHGKLALPNQAASKHLQLVVFGPMLRRWSYSNIKLTTMGGLYKKFSTVRAPTGSYNAVLYHVAADRQRKELSRRRFRVEAYRIPRFEVRVLSQAQVPADRPFQVRALARFYSGGLVTQRPIRWRVTSRVVNYRPPASRKGFYFASSHHFTKGPARDAKVVIDRSEKIDKQGQASLKIDPTLNLDLYPRRYTIEASVRGVDGRNVSGYRSISVLPPFTIGVQLKRRFRRKPGIIQAKMIALSPEGKLASDVPLRVTLLRREWHSHLMATDFVKGGVKYRTEVVDKAVARCTVSTQSREVTCPLKAKRSGVYILRVEGRDRLGRTQTLSLDLYVRGKERVAWARSKKSVFKLSLDRQKYAAGQSASVLIRSPFQTARALVIVEDPAGVQYHWVRIQGGQGLFRLPMKRRYAPSLPLHVVLMQGRVAQPNGLQGLDPGRPRTVASSLRIKLGSKQHRVMVALKLPKKARPREYVDVEITLRSPDGKPVPGEVTLWAVDRAVLSLGREEPLHPIRSFLRKRRSKVSIRDTRNLTVGRLPKRAERAGGGGGGIGNQNRVILRKNFKSVAYYNPSIVVGKSGKAKVRFRLPDDLTTFAVRAVAMSQTHRFGFQSRSLLVRLPVMIQRALPRFVRPGDQFFSGGIGRVAEGPGGPAKVSIQARGLVVAGEAQRAFKIPKDRAIPLFFQVAVPSRFQTQATVQMSLKRIFDGERDAFQVRIPIHPDRRRVFLIREQQLSSLGSPISMLSQWPEDIRSNSGRAEILVAGRGDLLRTAAAMEYLLGYPYGCTEQRISRAYPMLVLRKTLQQFAVRRMSVDRRQKAIKETIAHLRSVQNRRGLFGFWPGSKGNLALTTYAVSFLLEARSAGYKIQPQQIQQPLRALRRSLRSDFVPGLSRSKLLLRAQVVAALAQAKWHEPAYVRRLFAQRHKLDLFGQSQLLLAMSRDAERHGNRVSLLSTELESRVLTKKTQSGLTFAGIDFLKRVSQPKGSLSSKTRTLAAMLVALTAANPKSKSIALLQKGLLNSRSSQQLGYGWQHDGQGMSWGSTQNNAWALLAIRALLQRQQNMKLPKLALQTYRSKSKQWSQPFSFGGTQQTLWPVVIRSDQPLRFRMTGSKPKGPLWVRARLSYLPRSKGSSTKALNRGFAVIRNTTVVAKKGKEDRYYKVAPGKLQTISLGSLLEESVRLITGSSYSHVAVEVPIAAGLEVLNPSLRTSGSDARPQQKNTVRPTHIEYLDDRVRFFFSYLPSGDHRLYFRVRAVTRGNFTYPSSHAELMYRPSVFGRGPGYRLVIR